MFCPKCGAQLDDAARFCAKCGNQIESNNVQPSAQGAPINNAAIPSANNGAPAAAVRKKAKPLRVVIPIVIVVLLVLAGFAVWKMFFAPYNIDTDTFPDTSIRLTMASDVDTDKDGKISKDEAAAVTSLVVSDASSLDGLDKLPNLKELTLEGSNLNSVDASNLTSLEKLDVANCVELESLTLGELPNLKELNTRDRSLYNLDVSGCENLESLDVLNTYIGEIDVSDNSKLTYISASNNTVFVGLENTPLTEYWVVDSYQLSIPAIDNTKSKWESAKCTYDDNYNLSYIETYTKTGNNTGTTTTYNYYYDSNNICTGLDVSVDSKSLDKCTVEYDDLGRVAKFSSSLSGDWVYTYEEGSASFQPIQSTQGVGDGASSKTVYNYDDTDRLSSFTISSGGSPAVTWTLTYDDSGYVATCDSSMAGQSYTSSYKAVRDTDDLLTFASGTNTNNASYGCSFMYSSDGALESIARTLNPEDASHSDNNYYSVRSAEPTYDANGNLTKLNVTYENLKYVTTSADIYYGYRRYFSTDSNLDFAEPFNIGNPLVPFTDAYTFVNPERSIKNHISDAVYTGLPAVFFNEESKNYLLRASGL